MVNYTPLYAASRKASEAVEMLRKGGLTKEEALALEQQYHEAFAEQEQWLKETRPDLIGEGSDEDA